MCSGSLGLLGWRTDPGLVTPTQATILVLGGAFAVADGLWLHRAANRHAWWASWMLRRHVLQRTRHRYSRLKALGGAFAVIIVNDRHILLHRTTTTLHP